MPRISEFFGIVIYMYWFDQEKHKLPHFHAKYAEFKAVFTLKGRSIEGSLGLVGDRLVEEWAKSRKSEIQDAWSKAVHGQEIPWIKPIQ
jgi:hypothetical protein